MKWQLDKTKYLLEKEVKVLFAKVRELETKDRSEFRDYWVKVHMMLDLACSLGLRVSEIRSLRHGNFDFVDSIPSVEIIGKRGKRRFLPLSFKLMKHLSQFTRYKESIGLDTSPNAFLFPSPRNKYQPVSVGCLEEWFLKSLSVASIRRVTIHGCRHYFGYSLYRSTKDIKAVQIACGHASLETSQIYTDVQIDQLSKYLEQISNY